MLILSKVSKRKRAGVLAGIALLATTVTSLFVMLMDMTATIPAEVHHTAPLVRIFKITGFVALAILHWKVGTLIADQRPQETEILSSEDMVILTVAILSIAYAGTLFFPVLPIPGYEYPVASQIILKPIILGLIGITAILFHQPRSAKSEQQTIEKFPSLVSLLYIFAAKQSGRDSCSFCGDKIEPGNEFYEHIQKSNTSAESGSINLFCSALCVAANEKSK